MTDRMPTDTLPREMIEARNTAIGAAAKALWQEGIPHDSELPDFTADECQAFARIAVNAAWDSLGPLFEKLIARQPAL
jgi:hypothetical protein